MRAVVVILVILTALPVFAADAPEQVAITEVDALKIENVMLRLQVLEAQARPLAAERDRLVKEVAKKAEVDWDKYDLDLGNRLLVRRKGK